MVPVATLSITGEEEYFSDELLVTKNAMHIEKDGCDAWNLGLFESNCLFVQRMEPFAVCGSWNYLLFSFVYVYLNESVF